MKMTFIVIAYNSCKDLAACLDALLAAGDAQNEIIVVDNASHDGSADLVAGRYPSVRVLRSPVNLGFAGGANLGIERSDGDCVVILNPDVRLQPDAPARLRAAFADDRVGVVGCKLLYPDGQRLQHAGGIVDYPLATTRHRGDGETDHGQYDEASEVAYVTGAAMAVRRATMDALHGFDAGFFPVYYEDVDLCYRARAAGWRVVYWPQAVGLHRSSTSLDAASETYFRYLHANRLRFILKHYSTQQVLADVLPAEAKRLSAEMPDADRRASLLALAHPGDCAMHDDARRLPTEEALGEARRLWLVAEKPFSSRAPLIGPLIAAVRTAWNNVATRWYIQPMLQQQVEFNAAVLRAVEAIARRLDAVEGAGDAANAVIARRLTELERRLEHAETDRRS